MGSIDKSVGGRVLGRCFESGAGTLLYCSLCYAGAADRLGFYDMMVDITLGDERESHEITLDKCGTAPMNILG